jgi:hypothetical protein
VNEKCQKKFSSIRAAWPKAMALSVAFVIASGNGCRKRVLNKNEVQIKMAEGITGEGMASIFISTKIPNCFSPDLNNMFIKTNEFSVMPEGTAIAADQPGSDKVKNFSGCEAVFSNRLPSLET